MARLTLSHATLVCCSTELHNVSSYRTFIIFAPSLAQLRAHLLLKLSKVLLCPGYKPCDPQVIQDRVTHLEFSYQELTQLAAERRARLEESRRLWKFFWEMAEEEGWIREKEHILSSPEHGKDLTGTLRLLSQQRALEDEMSGRAAHLQHSIAEGGAMVAAGHFAAAKIQERIADLQAQWAALEQLAAARKKRLEDALALHQFQADALDVDTWTLDALRIVSSGETGHDEFSTQALARKHKDAAAEV